MVFFGENWVFFGKNVVLFMHNLAIFTNNWVFFECNYVFFAKFGSFQQGFFFHFAKISFDGVKDFLKMVLFIKNGTIFDKVSC